jgi:IS5 family transposase
MKQHGFFDENDRLKELHEFGDPLERLNTYINREQYGYKNHGKAGKKHKIITKQRVTSAEVHDSRELKTLVEEGKDKIIYADAAYVGEEEQTAGKEAGEG